MSHRYHYRLANTGLIISVFFADEILWAVSLRRELTRNVNYETTENIHNSAVAAGTVDGPA